MSAGVWLLLLVAFAGRAQSVDEFEFQLDETIRSACHGYLVDALPSALGWLKEQIYKNSPFCRRAESARNKDEMNGALQDAHRRYHATYGSLDRENRVDRNLNITIDCNSEYMCMEIRLQYRDAPTPVSQSQYDTVRDFCGERYSCIQSWFRQWPRALPQPSAAEETEMLTFDRLLNEPVIRSDEGGAEAELAVAAVPKTQVKPQPQPAPQAPLAPQPEPDSELQSASESQPDPDLVRLNRSIDKLCQCTLSNRVCIENPYGPVRQQIAQVEAQRLGYCQRWKQELSARVQTSTADGSELIEALTAVEADIRSADVRGQAIVRLAAEDFRRIRERVRLNQPFVATLELDRINALVAAGVPQTRAEPEVGQANSVADGPDQQSSDPLETSFVVGPRLKWAEAGRYCAQRGMRLPNVEEARAKRDQFGTDTFWGVWTSVLQFETPYGPKYQTMRWNGFTEGEFASSEQYTVCFR